jgi:hypothetical protein
MALALFDLLDAGDEAALTADVGVDLARVLVAGVARAGRGGEGVPLADGPRLPSGPGPQVVAVYGDRPVPAGCEEEARTVGRVAWHLTADPYRMLAFAPWRKVDAAARVLGVAAHDARRHVGAVETVLLHRLSKSCTWMPEEALIATVAHVLKAARAAARAAVSAAVNAHAVAPHAGGYQLLGCYLMERFVAERCVAMREGKWRAEQPTLAVDVTRDGVEAALDHFDTGKPYPLTRSSAMPCGSR